MNIPKLISAVALGLALAALLTRAWADPLIDSLADRQAREYRLAAPAGNDPLPDPVIEVSVPAALLPGSPPSPIASEVVERDQPVSLVDEAQGQVLRQDLEQFGYALFSQVPGTLAPVQGLPVPPGYRIGPGDTLVVQLWGKANVEYRLTVTREGRLLIPEFGPLEVSGMTFDDVKASIVDGFASRVIGARATVSMGDLRSIQFRLTGDVTRPGIYSVSGLATLVDALVVSGGVSYGGSLRNIELKRGGRTVSRIDLYDLLLRGETADDLPIEHNDVIFVPPLGPVTYVGGEVQRPAIYELNGERTVAEVLSLAGGLLPSAALNRSHIERIEAGRYRTIVDLAPAGGGVEIPVRDGDFLRILPVDDYMDDIVLLSGQVRRPGGYEFREGLTASELLGEVANLLPGAVLDYALIVREDRAARRAVVTWFDPAAALSAPGGAADPRLAARDEIVVFDVAGDRAAAQAPLVARLEREAGNERAPVVEIRGAIGQPGRYALARDARLDDLISAAGRAAPDADPGFIVIARTGADDGRTSVRIVERRAAAAEVLEPGDRVYLFGDETDRPALLAAELDRLEREAGHGRAAPIVRITGHVRFPGRYPQVEGLSAGALICAAGGLTLDAYGLTAERSRRMDAPGRAEGLVQETVDLDPRVAACRGGTPVRSGPVLAAGDELTLVQKPGWSGRRIVRLEGEVMRPGTYPVDREDTLCAVLERAGGLTDGAYAYGATFSRRSIRELQQRTLDEIQGQLDDLLVELSLSHSARNYEKTPAGDDKQEYLKIIRQLDRAEASGRMVIDLARAARCEAEADVALEDGDVLTVPRRPVSITVAGQVYVPTSHLYADDRDIADYIELSGGATVLGRLSHAYVIQPNGEVVGLRGRRTSKRALRRAIAPGARIVVPLNVDRMNATERAQSWTRSLFEAAVFAGIVL